MEVYINHKAVDATGVGNLADLLEREGLAQPGTAVATDNTVVRRDSWASTPLEEGMKLTVIRAVCGG